MQPRSPPACTVLSFAFRIAGRFAFPLPDCRFLRPPARCLKAHRVLVPERDRPLVTGLSLPSNDSHLRGLRLRVDPGLLLRFFACGFRCPFGLSAPLPRSGFASDWGRLNASDPLHLSLPASFAALPAIAPRWDFYSPRIDARQDFQPTGPPSESARSPLAPRNRFYC